MAVATVVVRMAVMMVLMTRMPVMRLLAFAVRVVLGLPKVLHVVAPTVRALAELVDVRLSVALAMQRMHHQIQRKAGY